MQLITFLHFKMYNGPCLNNNNLNNRLIGVPSSFSYPRVLDGAHVSAIATSESRGEIVITCALGIRRVVLIIFRSIILLSQSVWSSQSICY